MNIEDIFKWRTIDTNIKPLVDKSANFCARKVLFAQNLSEKQAEIATKVTEVVTILIKAFASVALFAIAGTALSLISKSPIVLSSVAIYTLYQNLSGESKRWIDIKAQSLASSVEDLFKSILAKFNSKTPAS